MTGNVVRFDAVGAKALATRISGVDRVQTAIDVSRATFPSGAPAVVIARSDEFGDALPGAVLAAVGALPGTSPGGSTAVPLLLTPGGALDTRAAAEIKRLGAKTAYVLGEQAAISNAAAQQLQTNAGITSVVRVGGANRFETAAAIKAQIEKLTGKSSSAVYIVNGNTFADAMSVAPLAAKQIRPILLASSSLPTSTAQALSGVTTATIVGGVAAVPATVSDAIAKHVTTVTARMAGVYRYATSVAVVGADKAAGMDVDKLWLATGTDWPDAIAAGVSVARNGGVLLLVPPADLGTSASKTYLTGLGAAASVTLLGGPAAISLNVESQVISIVG
jgi:putative cell wall-binding protein